MSTKLQPLTSKRCRAVGYDPETRQLVLDFAHGDAQPKLYRYLDVPESVFIEIERRQATQSFEDPTMRESVGIYLGDAVTGAFKDAEIPFAFEILDAEGTVIGRSKKPVRGAIER